MDVNENLFCHWKMEFSENRWDCFFIISMIPLSIVLFGALASQRYNVATIWFSYILKNVQWDLTSNNTVMKEIVKSICLPRVKKMHSKISKILQFKNRLKTLQISPLFSDFF